MRTYAPDAETFAECIGLRGSDELIATVYQRTIAKLEREPVEDYRIDFEDGYGIRSNEEEDGHAVSTARAVAAGVRQPQFPPFVGIRIKPLTELSRARGIRTLKLFLEALASESGIPANFAVTLPKVTVPQQVAELVRLLQPFPSVSIELMIETPQSIIDASGQFAIPKLLDAARGRCRGLHFGAYDYTASCDITAEHQSLTHPACDFARHVMQVIQRRPWRDALRWRNQHPAYLEGSRGGGTRSAPSLRARAAIAHARLLPGLGFASGTASHPLRRRVCVLPARVSMQQQPGCEILWIKRRKPLEWAKFSTMPPPAEAC